MNAEQRKHVANSLRIIGMAQFASYGYLAIDTDNWVKAVVSGVVYITFELYAVRLLKAR